MNDLLSTQPPWLRFSRDNINDVVKQIEKLGLQKNMGCFVMRGSQMRNWHSLFDEFSTSLKFPSYFGRNLNAFDDCMMDLAWLGFDGYAMFITESDLILEDCSADDLSSFVSHLQNIASYWNKAVVDGQPWDRVGKPFHWIFHPSIPI